MQATEEISDTISKDTHAGFTIPYGMQGGSPSDGGGAPLNLRHMFRGVRALHGEAGFAALQAAHVMVLGIGGVGSWIAEALCRTAVGELTLVDSDRVAPHDINRQIEATQATLGEIKTHALAVRLTGINPALKVHELAVRVTPENPDEVLGDCPAFVAEAIDDLPTKAAVTAWLKRRGCTWVCSGGAGGRTDPGRVQLGDLAQARGDALLARLRSLLRRDYGFPAQGQNWGITCIFSSQKPVYSSKEGYVSGDLPAFGTSMAVTATTGLRAAAWLINQIVEAGAPSAAPARITALR